jgi:REP element-mobilizing transposase RayT
LFHEISIILGKITADHVHMFISYRTDMPISKIVRC